MNSVAIDSSIHTTHSSLKPGSMDYFQAKLRETRIDFKEIAKKVDVFAGFGESHKFWYLILPK
jgi:hypothetical protein